LWRTWVCAVLISSVGCSNPAIALLQISRKTRKKFHIFLIFVHAQRHSYWCRLIDYAFPGCSVLFCKFYFSNRRSLGNITDLFTSIAVTGLLHCRKTVGGHWRSCAATTLYSFLVACVLNFRILIMFVASKFFTAYA